MFVCLRNNPYVVTPLVFENALTYFLQQTSHGNIIDALLNSSLIAFYNQSLNLSYTPLTIPKTYSTNTTIRSLLNTLMLDDYIVNLSYISYFNRCYPKTCTYTKLSRENLIDIILAAAGIIGGLTGILHVLVWYFIRFIQNKRTIRIRGNILNYFRNKIRTVNLFRHSNYNQRNEIISTRLYLLIVFITVFTFLFYTSLISTTVTITNKQPNYDQYLLLEQKYSSKLACSCSNMVIDYEKFLSFNPEFHQICSSSFVDSRFYDLFSDSDYIILHIEDIRRFYWFIFDTIAYFCAISKKTIDEQLKIFLSTKFLSSQMINQEYFSIEINQTIQSMIQTTQKQTKIPIKLIRDITYSNQV